MAHQRSTRNARRALRREAPSTVAVLAHARDFAAMRSYRSFPFHDHQNYLRRMEDMVRSLASRGVHVSVALFDPEEYAEYCAHTGQDPDTAVTRTRYTAEIAVGGPLLPYTGRPLDHLITRLTEEAGRQATWEHATEMLAGAVDDCPDRVLDIAGTAFERASQAVTGLLESVGTGTHHLVCSVRPGDAPLTGILHAESDENGRVHLVEAEALIVCTVLAAAIATNSPGGVVLRTSTPGGPDEVRGWSLRDGWIHPLSEAEVFNAYCTDADTGEPVPPEAGVVHRAGTRLPYPAN